MQRKEKIIILLLVVSLVFSCLSFGISLYSLKAQSADSKSISFRDNPEMNYWDMMTNGLDISSLSGSSPDSSDSSAIAELSPGIESFARSFVAAYGTYPQPEAIESGVKLTKQMKKMVDQGVKFKDGSLDNVQSISTEVLSVHYFSGESSKGKMLLTVSTKRSEARKGESEPRIFNQDMLLTLKTEDNEWKVDNAEWQKESQ